MFSKHFLNKKKTDIPVFKIDCSDQTNKYVEDWLIKQRDNQRHFYYGGWGETLLLSNGNLTDFISNPGQLGAAETKQKIAGWKSRI